MTDLSNLVFGQIFNKMLQIKQSDTELTWYGGEKSKPIFSETKLLAIKNLSLDHYEFLMKIDRNFINITKYPFDLKSCFEYNAAYRFDNEYLRKIMQDYVRPDDLDQSLVAGGFFSKYVENSISTKFPRLFSLLSSKSDIDIFILNGSSQIYKAWFLQRKIKVHSEYCTNHYCNSYSRFENFKIETDQNQIVNLILSQKLIPFGNRNGNLVVAVNRNPPLSRHNQKYLFSIGLKVVRKNHNCIQKRLLVLLGD